MLLTVYDAAERLNCHSDQVYAAIHDGRLAVVDISRPGAQRRRWRITEKALEDFIVSQTKPVNPPQPRRRSSKPSKQFV